MALLFLLVPAGCAAGTPALREFPDRPVAWQEHDDMDVPRPPKRTFADELYITYFIRDDLLRRLSHDLSLPQPRPAADVNALDEVPCSTWFCARNHLRPLATERVGHGPSQPPELPLVIVRGKDVGAAPGFRAHDAAGRLYLLKFDPPRHVGLASGAEAVVSRLMWAAGYHVPGAFVLDVAETDVRLEPGATYERHGYEKRPLDAKALRAILRGAARLPDGRLRAVAVPWIEGQAVGGFDFRGRRPDDPNDRIPHQDRRSLRASYVLFAWLNLADAGTENTVDAWVEEDGRHFVRHYLVDFGSGLGSWTRWPKGPLQGNERFIDLGRTFAALFALGAYQRAWQGKREEAAAENRQLPEVGFLEAEGWDPAGFRTQRTIDAHLRMTRRDAYWGAKVVTSFTDAQIAAVVAAACYSPRAAAAVEHALRVRRDLIGRRWLTGVTAVEHPVARDGGRTVCFRDLAIERSAARAADVVYRLRITDGSGRTLLAGEVRPASAGTCLPTRAETGTGDYRVVAVTARVKGRAARTARIHLRRRPAEGGFVVVGVDRDE